jgi:hypothetical protein
VRGIGEREGGLLLLSPRDTEGECDWMLVHFLFVQLDKGEGKGDVSEVNNSRKSLFSYPLLSLFPFFKQWIEWDDDLC